MYNPTSPRRALAPTMINSAAPPFLASLYEILSKEDPTVIAWCDNGKAFGVYNFDVMEQYILPTYFRHNKFASFQRQLNYFGFRKLQKPNGATSPTRPSNIYCQPLFTRDNPSAMIFIKRKTYGLKPVSTPRRMTTPDYYPFSTTPVNVVPSHAIPAISRSSSAPSHFTWSLHTAAPMLRRSHSASAPKPVDFDEYLSMTSSQTTSYEQLLHGVIPGVLSTSGDAQSSSNSRLSIDASMADAFAAMHDDPVVVSVTPMLTQMQTVTLGDGDAADGRFAPLPFSSDPRWATGPKLSSDDWALLACIATT
ncbi:hypothetical protein H310_05520 [Aphanomyces invadans]|uniref:HSF-type DNA-binding domain-containing protein n=1 Tax=Aphanomyces invadans TaxID=157072 RepID=A0A024U9Y7_9STRA|nr:hypothetical protein H310_05520 [Aphanomyces invadans]ETW03094.1 hypothetical protein H310_05520 [Aphanomyces invadans]RHY34403.1 hypothetical protein DYB32_000953 [Aphanomyces invadans]|eukprot:XP_008868478.1 hypothetical protein H310_05520 [Aphanomyces invadans]